MTPSQQTELDRAHVLMMAVLDGEATSEEQAELETLLAEQLELRPDWDRLRRVKEVTATMTIREPSKEVWDSYWTSVYRRTERRIAWLLVSAGAAVLLAWAGWHAILNLLTDANLPLAIRLAMFALILGAAILLVSVVREKVFLWRRDPYSKEVVR